MYVCMYVCMYVPASDPQGEYGRSVGPASIAEKFRLVPCQAPRDRGDDRGGPRECFPVCMYVCM